MSLSSSLGESVFVSVPLEMTVLPSGFSLPSVEEFMLFASSTGSCVVSNLEIASALFHVPGQCTTVILNCAKKSRILRTARLV